MNPSDQKEETIEEIEESIRLAVREGPKFFEVETQKLLKNISLNLQKFVDKANYYKKLIAESKSEWEAIRTEVKALEEKKDVLKKLEDDINAKKLANDKEAEDLQILHKVLENRRTVMDAREKDLDERDRRSRV
jgi:predicted transcriptional regulator